MEFMHKLMGHFNIKILKNSKSCLEHLSVFKLSKHKEEPVSLFQRREHTERK